MDWKEPQGHRYEDRERAFGVARASRFTGSGILGRQQGGRAADASRRNSVVVRMELEWNSNGTQIEPAVIR